MKVSAITDKEFVPASHEDKDKPGVLKKVLFNAQDFDPACGLKMLNFATIAPGESFVLHEHQTLEEVFYILKGKGEMRVGDEMTEVSAGMAILVPPKHMHTMKNTGDEVLEFMNFGAASD